MGTSSRKRTKRIYSKNKENRNKKIERIEKNYEVLKSLGYYEILNAEKKTIPPEKN